MPGHARCCLDPTPAVRSRCSAVRSRCSLIAVVVVLVLGFSTAATAAAQVGVSIVFRAYQPATTTVNVGETVKWTNLGFGPHTVTALGGMFDSGRLEVHETFSVTFANARELSVRVHDPSEHEGHGHRAQRAGAAGRSGQPVQAQRGTRKPDPGARPRPRPGARVSVELQKGSKWRRVAQGRLSQQGKATLSVSSSSHRPLRVVVAGQPGEPTLMSRVLRALG